MEMLKVRRSTDGEVRTVSPRSFRNWPKVKGQEGNDALRKGANCTWEVVSDEQAAEPKKKLSPIVPPDVQRVERPKVPAPPEVLAITAEVDPDRGALPAEPQEAASEAVEQAPVKAEKAKRPYKKRK